ESTKSLPSTATDRVRAACGESRSTGRSARRGSSARPLTSFDDRRCSRPSLRSAGELRLCEICGRLLQDLLGAPQLEILFLKLLQAGALVGRQAGTLARVLFVLVIRSHGRRRVVHVNVTDHPTAAWTRQQIREASPDHTAPAYLIRDRPRR